MHEVVGSEIREPHHGLDDAEPDGRVSRPFLDLLLAARALLLQFLKAREHRVQKLEDDSSSKLPEWSSLLDEQGKQHLKEITEIREIGFNSITFSLMMSRFSEYLLRRYFFLPLAAMVELSECVPWERAKNASAYLLDRTLREPSLGDMISLIKQMAYQRNRSNPYIRMLRQATLQISIDFDQFFSYDFIGSLCRLRDYRNCIMHADDPSIEDFEFVRSFIFAGNDHSPGEFVSTLIRVDQV